MTETVNLHYTDQGEGLPVVLLHGFPLDHRIWRDQIAALSTNYRVIAPDLRGYGESPFKGDTFPMHLLAADVAAVLDVLDIDRAVWVGHSMGGYITMAALRTLPERVLATGYVATHPHADPAEKRMQRIQSADKIALEGGSDLILSMMGVLFDPALNRKSEPAQRVYDIMQHTKTGALIGALRGMAERPDSVETLQNAGVPAVVIAGAQDQVVEPDIARTFAQTIDAPLHMVEGAGHMVMVEQPDATTEALESFLQRVSKR